MGIRVIGALAAVVSAAVHLYLWFDGVRDQGTVGQLFVVNVVAGAVIAVLVVAWRSWIPLLLLAGLGATTLLAFVIATTGGLFGIHTTWGTWYAWLAAISEVLAVVVAVAAASAEGWFASLRSLGAHSARRRTE
ncbi:hypothetical protein ACFFOS_26105 [Nocardioides kongjuensis]|uniref:Uncharacterized protein n=1 Tax=Nocardioides kongjuensis TaxID=349522 RepID=A0A852RTL2_9ACTN|nr:hypothetical protein [Nocardioides kongjuensis]NYD31234.1 hypothetical protein [Nocardioides kongjuensis]